MLCKSGFLDADGLLCYSISNLPKSVFVNGLHFRTCTTSDDCKYVYRGNGSEVDDDPYLEDPSSRCVEPHNSQLSSNVCAYAYGDDMLLWSYNRRRYNSPSRGIEANYALSVTSITLRIDYILPLTCTMEYDAKSKFKSKYGAANECR